jgi:hypothetical protein
MSKKQKMSIKNVNKCWINNKDKKQKKFKKEVLITNIGLHKEVLITNIGLPN